MTRNADANRRAIVGAVIQSGRIYKAGDEDALLAAMRGGSVAHLLAKGVITGDWGGAPAGEPEPADVTVGAPVDDVATENADEPNTDEQDTSGVDADVTEQSDAPKADAPKVDAKEHKTGARRKR